MLRKFVCGLALIASFSVFSSSYHFHPKHENNPQQDTKKSISWAGYCEIEVVNNSYDDIRVSGVFDDGSPLYPFTVYSYEAPHYISLYYYGYCHDGMMLYIDSYSGYRLFAGYVNGGSTTSVYSRFGHKIEAVVKQK